MPICRGLRAGFDAIPDPTDGITLSQTCRSLDATADPTRLRVGYLRSQFEGEVEDTGDAERTAFARETRSNNLEALSVIRSLGIEVVPFDLPDVPVETIDFLRYVETSAAFYEVTMNGQLAQTESGPEQSVRPIEIRAGHFTPGVEYVQGNRMRMRIMQQVDEALGDLDLYLGLDLLLTNRTGHPALSVPSGFHQGFADSAPHDRKAVRRKRSSCCLLMRSRRTPIITLSTRCFSVPFLANS